MISILLFIQDTHSDKMSLKKFIYLMINAIERLNNTRRFDRINDKESSFESLNDLIKEFSLIVKESFKLTNKRLSLLKTKHYKYDLIFYC